MRECLDWHSRFFKYRYLVLLLVELVLVPAHVMDVLETVTAVVPVVRPVVVHVTDVLDITAKLVATAMLTYVLGAVGVVVKDATLVLVVMVNALVVAVTVVVIIVPVVVVVAVVLVELRNRPLLVHVVPIVFFIV